MPYSFLRLVVPGVVLAGAAALWPSGTSFACPFCSAVSTTLSEDIKANDAVVIARLVKRSAAPAAAESSGQAVTLPADASLARFEIVHVIKGREHLGAARQIEVLYFGQHPAEQQFLIYGIDPKNWAWTTPNPVSPRAVEYVKALVKLPESGPERLAFFQDYFEDSDTLLAGDAYDEFAKAPYAEVHALKDKMDREKLWQFLNNPETSTSHRRLYLTMLGVCGGPDDIASLERMIRNDNRQVRMALDAMVSCYLNLKGPEGLPLVEELFLKNSRAEYTDTYATIMALRFHGQEVNVIPKERLTAALRHMLQRPQLADLVIPDLARWQDWSVMDQLVKLFKEADEDSVWVRVPVINYLRACPLPEAKQRIEELKLVDADAVKRANQFFPLGAGGRPPASKPDANAAQAPPAAAPAPAPGADKKKVEEPKKPAADARQEPASASIALKAPAGTLDESRGDGAPLARPRSTAPRFADAAGGRFSAAAAPQSPQVRTLTVVVWAAVAASSVLLLLLTILRGNRHYGAI